jgi:hypothetical protein
MAHHTKDERKDNPFNKGKSPRTSRKNEKLETESDSSLKIVTLGDLYQVNDRVLFSNKEHNEDGFNEHEVKGMYDQVERASLYCADRGVHTYVRADIGKRDFYVRIDKEGVVRNPPLIEGKHPSMRVKDIELIAESVVEYDPVVDV